MTNNNKFSLFSLPIFFGLLIVCAFALNQYNNDRTYQQIVEAKQPNDMAILSNNGETIRIGLKHTENNQAGSIVDLNTYGELTLFMFIPKELANNPEFIAEFKNLMEILKKFLDSDGFTVANFFHEVPKFQLGLDNAINHYGNYQNITRDSTPNYIPEMSFQLVVEHPNVKKLRTYNLEEILANDIDLSAPSKKVDVAKQTEEEQLHDKENFTVDK